MLQKILQHDLREQAGPNTYNRFEYQVGWTVYKTIEKYKNNEPFNYFSEYHDDMSEITNDNKMSFYQVKTKNKANFTFNLITKKHASKKHSFLGYLFYNHYNFGSDCKECYFISNRPFDEKINQWQSIIQDKHLLLNNNADLYNEIKDIIKFEYDYNNLSSSDKANFDNAFNNFIQNTIFKVSSIPLDNSFAFIRTKFFEVIKFESINMSSAHLIFDSVFETVRERTKKTVITPISLVELKEQKGIDESIFRDIQVIREKDNIVSIIDSLKHFCIENSQYFNTMKITQLVKALNLHYKNYINVTNVNYKEEINDLIVYIKKNIDENLDELDSINNLLNLKEKVVDYAFSQSNNPLIKKVTLEVIFYVEFLNSGEF